jgi:polar amino acid transport system permease protein
MHETTNTYTRLTEGFWLNCKLFFLTLIFALPLGLIISFGSMSKWKPLAMLTKTIVWVVRGTPLMLQIIIIFFIPSLLFGWQTPFPGVSGRFTAATIAFVINYSCYFSEIYRGGIQGIPIGQTEAGQVLGMTKTQIFFKITLLQVIKRILPPMGNEIITLIKDTSLARIIAVMEVIMVAEIYTNKGLIWPLFSTGIYFLVFVGILTVLFNKLEKKMNYFVA